MPSEALWGRAMVSVDVMGKGPLNDTEKRGWDADGLRKNVIAISQVYCIMKIF